MQITQRVFAPFMEVKLQLLTKPAVANFVHHLGQFLSSSPREAENVNPNFRWQITEKKIILYN